MPFKRFLCALLMLLLLAGTALGAQPVQHAYLHVPDGLLSAELLRARLALLPDGIDAELVPCAAADEVTIYRLTLPATAQLTTLLPQLLATPELIFVDFDGTVWLSAAQVESAHVISEQGMPAVSITLTPEGRACMARASEAITARADGMRTLAIVVDRQVLSSPQVNERIDTVECIITGVFTREQADELAALISTCLHPRPNWVTQAQLESLSATVSTLTPWVALAACA